MLPVLVRASSTFRYIDAETEHPVVNLILWWDIKVDLHSFSTLGTTNFRLLYLIHFPQSSAEVTCGAGGPVVGLELPTRVFPCASPADVRATLPEGVDVLAFQCRNPIHKAHYELFIRALEASNVGPGAVCLVHPTCGPTQVSSPPPPPQHNPTHKHPSGYCFHPLESSELIYPWITCISP